MSASCHYLATQVAFSILEAGGNAIDAGVAAGLALGVVESAYVSVAGVAPIAIYLKDGDRVVTISGLGSWPRAASCDFFRQRHQGAIPKGILRTVVPAAMDSWITALEMFGTMRFAEVAAGAIGFARDGFVMYELMSATIAEARDDLRSWPSSAAIYLPDGAPPPNGKMFLQRDLAATLQYLADEERAAAPRGRVAGLQAARDAFYRGDVAARIAAYHRDNGGLLDAHDLAAFRVDVEPAVPGRFGDIDVFACNAWCQGPMLLQQLGILDGTDLRGLGHNSLAYVHLLTEAIKLSAADREAFYGDPRFVDVPLEKLLSAQYGADRRAMIDPLRAFPDLPPAGRFDGVAQMASTPRASAPRVPAAQNGIVLDTSYVCVLDRHGNAFSATPSDGITGGPVVPGTGLLVSCRGGQSWTQPGHPSSIMPGKRPRLTPNPAIAIRRGKFVMPFGTPGHDTQTQVMLQVFLNIMVFGMSLQEAVEAPRIATLSFPSSAYPHANAPGRLLAEDAIFDTISPALAELGHNVERWPATGPDYYANVSAACVALRDLETGMLFGAADHRRPATAAGW
jgi:gamma-glutamyltranspeptidase/glutathione hydrolase